MKNPTFSRFTHCKSVFSFALNNFISAFFACIFFIYTRFEKENINTLTGSSEFLITLFSGFAQAESESLSTIITWGQQQSMKNGKVTFQCSKLLGYRRGEDGQPEIVPEDAEIVKRIFRRYLDGCSLGQIKAELESDGAPTASGVKGWSYQVIHNILTNGCAIIGVNQQALVAQAVTLI